MDAWRCGADEHYRCSHGHLPACSETGAESCPRERFSAVRSQVQCSSLFCANGVIASWDTLYRISGHTGFCVQRFIQKLPASSQWSLPSLSCSSSTSSYAGLYPSSSPSPCVLLLSAGFGCVSVVPPKLVYPMSYNLQYGILKCLMNCFSVSRPFQRRAANDKLTPQISR